MSPGLDPGEGVPILEEEASIIMEVLTGGVVESGGSELVEPLRRVLAGERSVALPPIAILLMGGTGPVILIPVLRVPGEGDRWLRAANRGGISMTGAPSAGPPRKCEAPKESVLSIWPNGKRGDAARGVEALWWMMEEAERIVFPSRIADSISGRGEVPDTIVGDSC